MIIQIFLFDHHFWNMIIVYLSCVWGMWKFSHLQQNERWYFIFFPANLHYSHITLHLETKNKIHCLSSQISVVVVVVAVVIYFQSSLFNFLSAAIQDDFFLFVLTIIMVIFFFDLTLMFFIIENKTKQSIRWRWWQHFSINSLMNGLLLVSRIWISLLFGVDKPHTWIQLLSFSLSLPLEHDW